MSANWIDERIPSGLGGKFYGVYPALVVDVLDPEGQGRVRIKLPWAQAAENFEEWARLSTMMAGNKRGSFFVPDPGDEVLVAFGGGDPSQPFVVGALWNGKDQPPTKMEKGNNKKVLRSRRGVQVAISDREGKEAIVIETPGGQKLTLEDGPAGVTIEDANHNRLKFSNTGVSLESTGTVAIRGSEVKIDAGKVTVNAGMSSFSANISCQTIIATTVVGSTYTPGAGNIW